MCAQSLSHVWIVVKKTWGEKSAFCQGGGDGYGKVFKDGMPNDLSLGSNV